MEISTFLWILNGYKMLKKYMARLFYRIRTPYISLVHTSLYNQQYTCRHVCSVIVFHIHYYLYDIDGSVQDCGNSSALAMELLQPCTKPSI